VLGTTGGLLRKREGRRNEEREVAWERGVTPSSSPGKKIRKKTTIESEGNSSKYRVYRGNFDDSSQKGNVREKTLGLPHTSKLIQKRFPKKNRKKQEGPPPKHNYAGGFLKGKEKDMECDRREEAGGVRRRTETELKNTT